MKKVNINKFIFPIMIVMLLALLSIPFVCLSAQAQISKAADIYIDFQYQGNGHGKLYDDASNEVLDASVEVGTQYTRSGDQSRVLTLSEPSGKVTKLTAIEDKVIPGKTTASSFTDYILTDGEGITYKLPDEGTLNENVTIGVEFMLSSAFIQYFSFGTGTGSVDNPATFFPDIIKGSPYTTTETDITFYQIDFGTELTLSAIPDPDCEFSGFFIADSEGKFTVPLPPSGIADKNMIIGFRFDAVTSDVSLSSNDEGHSAFKWTYKDGEGNITSGEDATFNTKFPIGLKYIMREDGTIDASFDIPEPDPGPGPWATNDDPKFESKIITPVPKDGYKFKSFELNGNKLETGKTYEVVNDEDITGAVTYEKLPPSGAATNNTGATTQTGDVLFYAILALIICSSLATIACLKLKLIRRW